MAEELVKENTKYILTDDRLEVYVKTNQGGWRLRDTVSGAKAKQLFESLSKPHIRHSCMK